MCTYMYVDCEFVCSTTNSLSMYMDIIHVHIHVCGLWVCVLPSPPKLEWVSCSYTCTSPCRSWYLLVIGTLLSTYEHKFYFLSLYVVYLPIIVLHCRPLAMIHWSQLSKQRSLVWSFLNWMIYGLWLILSLYTHHLFQLLKVCVIFKSRYVQWSPLRIAMVITWYFASLH